MISSGELLSDMGGVFGFFLGVSLLKCITRVWQYWRYLTKWRHLIAFREFFRKKGWNRKGWRRMTRSKSETESMQTFTRTASIAPLTVGGSGNLTSTPPLYWSVVPLSNSKNKKNRSDTLDPGFKLYNQMDCT